jgi:BlaI family penicillinase repressor
VLTFSNYRCKLKIQITNVIEKEMFNIMKVIPKISDAEWEVMKIIWNSHKITSSSIIEELKDKEDWKPATIKSLLSRLLNKKAIDFEKVGKEYYYYPTVSEEECIKVESESFIKRVFNGSVNSMLLNFVKQEKLSEGDLEELRNLLNKSSNEDRD